MRNYSDDQLGQLLSETGRLLEGAPTVEETFSLDDILAEFGQGAAQPAQNRPATAVPAEEPPALPEEKLAEPVAGTPVKEVLPEAEQNPAPEHRQEKVVAFPGVRREEPEPVQEPAPEEPESGDSEEDSPGQSMSLEEIMNQTVSSVLDEDDVLLDEEVPLKKRLQMGLSGGLDTLRQWADRLKQVKRPARPAKPKPPEEPEPDMEQAALESKRCCSKLHRHLLWLLIPVVLLVAVTVADALAPLPTIWWEMSLLRCGVPGGLLLIAALLALDVWREMALRMRRGQVTTGLGAGVLTLVCLGDCVYGAVNGTELFPFAALAGLLLLACQYGLLLENSAKREAFRLADLGGAPPFVVSVTAAGACKQQGKLEGFYRTACRQDPAGRWQTVLVPMLTATATVLAGVVCLSGGYEENLLWVWSAILSASLPLSLPLTGTLPLNRVSRRLAKSGSAVAGYQGARSVSASKRMVLTDNDLFPPGTVSLNGMKIYGEEIGRVLSYAATVARAADSQLVPLLEQLLTAEGGCHLPIQDFQFFEEGGCGGTIRGETVIMGSAYFMKKRKVALPRELKVKTGVFLAVDGQLIAIFAIQYHASRNVDWALRLLRRSRIQPVLAVRGSNITPGLLRQKFGRDIKPIYPDVSARLALSGLSREMGSPNAIIYREGLMPFAETVIGSRRLLRAVRWGTILCYVGALIGLLLTYYLTGVGAFDALSPLRMLVFAALWLLPTALLSGMVRHY
ncbi:MAG: hypothetical protein E7457_04135 [Ruminococcaceae bacterium]|nr:hypothetical protein [Oscillospiraceae bacterium]